MTNLERRALDHIIRAAQYPSQINNKRLKTYGKELKQEREIGNAKPIKSS